MYRLVEFQSLNCILDRSCLQEDVPESSTPVDAAALLYDKLMEHVITADEACKDDALA